MSVEMICEDCGEEYDTRHGECPMCSHLPKRERKSEQPVGVKRVISLLAETLEREILNVNTAAHTMPEPYQAACIAIGASLKRIAEALRAQCGKRANQRCRKKGTRTHTNGTRPKSRPKKRNKRKSEMNNQTSTTLHPEAQKLLDGNANGEHTQYPRSDWQYEVGNGDTQLGYWDWLSHRLESEQTPDGQPA